jgi:hypothetical protein
VLVVTPELQDRADQLGQLLDVVPAKVWEWDTRNRCWCLHGGPAGRRLEWPVTVQLWGDHSYRWEDGGLSHGPGVPGITELVDPGDAIDAALACVSAWLLS